MLARPQPVFTNRGREGLSGPCCRWLTFAQQLASRRRRQRRHIGVTMHWLRRLAGTRWLRSVYSHLSSPMQLNLGVNVQVHEGAEVVRQFVSRHNTLLPLPLAHSVQPAASDHGPLRISQNFVMQRFVTERRGIVEQPMRPLGAASVHTSVRPVVRTNTRVECRLLSRPTAERPSSAEVSAAGPKAFPATVVSMPAGIPVCPPEINVAQIADQVMRQLDHRISSWRERRGRS